MKEKAFVCGAGAALFFALTFVGSPAVATAHGAGEISVVALSVAEDEEWKELEDFHHVMAETFHPLEEGDLKPIRARAEELAKKASAWAKSTPPKRFAGVNVKEKLAKLDADSHALAKLVAANGGDEDIKKALTALHDEFHEIAERCHHAQESHKPKA
jgi:hypothetical protein